jgi:hypothetical protein
LAQDVHRADLNHLVLVVELLRGWKNHHEQANLHVCVENLVLMVCEVHLQMDGALQSELDALLALGYLLDVKDEMAFVLFHPCFSPSRFSIFNSMTFVLGK